MFVGRVGAHVGGIDGNELTALVVEELQREPLVRTLRVPLCVCACGWWWILKISRFNTIPSELIPWHHVVFGIY